MSEIVTPRWRFCFFNPIRMKNLLVRTLTGAVYVAAIVLAILYGHQAGFAVLCMVLAVPAVLEFLKMTKGDLAKHKLTASIDILSVLLVLAPLATCECCHVSLINSAILLLVMRAVAQLYVKVENSVNDYSLSIAGIIYVALPLYCAGKLMDYSQGLILLLMFVMIWLNDTGAFLVGSAIGRHKLCERLSPKKSWEGFIGGVCFSVLAGVVASCYFSDYLIMQGSVWFYAGMGIVVSLFSTWGDLFESMIKRTVGVKDSGKLLPGHGGMLDRVDSLLFVAPVLMAYIAFCVSFQ